MQRLQKILDKTTSIFAKISTAILILIMALMTVNVITSKLFNTPISGSVELVQYGMLVCISLAVSRTGIKGRHLYVSVIQDILPIKVRAVIKSSCMLISVVVFGWLVMYFINALPVAIVSNRVTDVLHIPYWYTYVMLAITMIIVSLTFLYQALLALMPLFEKERLETSENDSDQMHYE